MNRIQPNIMYFTRQQISQAISKISQSRHTYDHLYSQLQYLLKNKRKYTVVDLRNKFISSIQQLQNIVKDNQTILDLLNYRTQKLSKDGVELNTQKIRIDALKQYFCELKDKVKREQDKGEEIIAGLERWEITKQHNDTTYHDDEQSLLNSHKVAKQTTQIARGVFQSLSNQGNRLQNTREKMGQVLRNINFSGNLAQVLRTRTKEDNRLIVLLSIGLFFWIIICIFAIKPWYRG